MMIRLVIGVLFLKKVSVVIAFAAISMVVITPRITSSLGRILAGTIVSIGGLSTVAGFVFFTICLLGIYFSEDSWIKYLYKLTSL